MDGARSHPRLAASSGAAAAPAGTERVRAAEAERQSLAAILNLVRSGQAQTRLDIERAARLGRAVVADRLATLSGFGLVDEGGLGRSIGGRAPRLLRFQADAGRLLVGLVERDTIGVGVADLAGRLLVEHYEEVEAGTPADGLVERLIALFAWLSDQAQGGGEPWGIGLGLPQAGDLPGVDDDGAEDADASGRFAQRLAERFRSRVVVRSAIQMETRGEVSALPPGRAGDLLFVNLSADITAGIVAGGQLLAGAHGVAGQLGHVYAGEGFGAVCGCGNVGCLQSVVGCEALECEARRAAEEGRSPALADVLARTGGVTVSDLGLAARMGDPFAAELLGRSGRLIGTALATLLNLMNPAVVLLGGDLAQTGDIFLAAVREAIYRHARPVVTRDLLIQRSRMSRSSGLVGAAAVVVDDLFAAPILERWITVGSPLLAPAANEVPAAAVGRHSPSTR